MSLPVLARLAKIAGQIRDRDLASFAAVRARRAEADKRVAALAQKLDAEASQYGVCEEIALKIAEAHWERVAEHEVAALRREAEGLVGIEQSARNAAARALGRYKAVDLLRRQGESDARAARARRNERDGFGC